MVKVRPSYTKITNNSPTELTDIPEYSQVHLRIEAPVTSVVYDGIGVRRVGQVLAVRVRVKAGVTGTWGYREMRVRVKAGVTGTWGYTEK